MGAQLSRIGPGRSALVVIVCAVLSLAGLTRSGLAGDPSSSADSRDPVVLAPPVVKDPDLGTVERVRKTAKHKAAKAQRTKTCVLLGGQRVRVDADFKCPKAVKFRAPGVTGAKKGATVPGGQTPGAPQGPAAQPPGTTKTGPASEGFKPTKPSGPAKKVGTNGGAPAG